MFDYKKASTPEQNAYDAGFAALCEDCPHREQHEAEALPPTPEEYPIDPDVAIKTLVEVHKWLATGIWQHHYSPREHLTQLLRQMSSHVQS